jgi:hypothetical protein
MGLQGGLLLDDQPRHTLEGVPERKVDEGVACGGPEFAASRAGEGMKEGD